MTFYVHADNVTYIDKPDSFGYGALTNRIKKSLPVTMDIAALCNHVRQGKTFVSGVYSNPFKEESFLSMQLGVLDFDNQDSSKNRLQPGQEGYIDPLDMLDRCVRLGVWPACIYFTLSSDINWLRFRAVFDFKKPITDYREAKATIAKLMKKFPECDPQVKNPNRLFLGSNGEVWETWQVEQW